MAMPHADDTLIAIHTTHTKVCMTHCRLSVGLQMCRRRRYTGGGTQVGLQMCCCVMHMPGAAAQNIGSQLGIKHSNWLPLEMPSGAQHTTQTEMCSTHPVSQPADTGLSWLQDLASQHQREKAVTSSTAACTTDKQQSVTSQPARRSVPLGR